MVGADKLELGSRANVRANWRAGRLVRIALVLGGLGGGLGSGVVAGCLSDLPRGRSCGDGWWDPEHEQCDKSSPDDSYIEACRAEGWHKDADCDPVTCEILASEEDCQICGDAIAMGTEQCDGNDVRGAKCPGGAGQVLCTSECTLDLSQCPQVCGDGIVNGTEECEAALSCGDDGDCAPGSTCYPLFGECIPSDGFSPNLSCSFYNNKAIGVSKPYVSGTIDRCTDDCFFGRNKCGFCGDGELDTSYTDFVYPDGDAVTFPREVCDGEEALPDRLEAYCEPLCIDEAINSDVSVACDFDCNAGCTDFATPGDIVPGGDPSAINCCLAKESPCPKFPTAGVPDLPCCGWLDNPQWMEEQTCVVADTDDVPIVFVCP